jgi:hypothetical protein
MTVKAPTSSEIEELAEARTTRFYGPKDPPPHHNADNWARERRRAYAQQTDAARAELTHRFELARGREDDRAARAQAQADEREAELRRRFDRRFPGGSDADYQAMRPTLMAELSSEAAQAEEAARAQARARIRF